MYLSRFLLTQFKNYDYQLVECAPRLNCFVGRNGSGKTNLLESIYYLCMGKGYESNTDQYAIQHEGDFFRLEGRFTSEQEQEDKVVVKVQKRKRKIIERNGATYERIADHVGRYPVVIVVPDDVRLVHEGSEYRRRLVDNSLSQTDSIYLNHLMVYNKVLAQRNALLKQYAGHTLPAGLLEVYDGQLAGPATYIHSARSAFIQPFEEMLAEAHAAISGEQETVAVRYRSQLNDQDWGALLAERREKDRILQRTTGGIHRDDLVFTQEGHPLRRVASQGQLKTFVLSLKLAQYQLLRKQTQREPLLLLDDIFDKLDQERVAQLLNFILREEYGQIFITDTDPNRVAGLVNDTDSAELVRYRVENGVATKL